MELPAATLASPLKDRYALAPLAMFDLGLEAGPLAEPPFRHKYGFSKKECLKSMAAFELTWVLGLEVRSETKILNLANGCSRPESSCVTNHRL